MSARIGGQPHARGQHAIGVVARIHRDERREAAAEQGRADQQDDRERGFDGEEHAAHARAGRADRARAAGLHRRGEIDARASERRRGARHDAREDRGEHRGAEEADVDANLLEAREIRGREHGHGGGQRDADDDAERAAEERDDEAFGEELTHQAAASRAERGAHRQLAAARAAAREEQIGEVGARDQQHQRDARGQHHQRRPHSHRHLFHERADAHFDRTALAEDQLRQRADRQPRATAVPSASACAAVTPGARRAIALVKSITLALGLG